MWVTTIRIRVPGLPRPITNRRRQAPIALVEGYFSPGNRRSRRTSRPLSSVRYLKPVPADNVVDDGHDQRERARRAHLDAHHSEQDESRPSCQAHAPSRIRHEYPEPPLLALTRDCDADSVCEDPPHTNESVEQPSALRARVGLEASSHPARRKPRRLRRWATPTTTSRIHNLIKSVRAAASATRSPGDTTTRHPSPDRHGPALR